VREVKDFLVILKPGVFQSAMKAILYPTKCLQQEALAMFNRLAEKTVRHGPDQAMMHYLLELMAISDRIIAFGYTGNGKVIPSALGKSMWFGLAAQGGLMPCLNPNVVRLGGTPENLLEILPAAWPMDATRRIPLQSSDRCQFLTYGWSFAAVSTIYFVHVEGSSVQQDMPLLYERTMAPPLFGLVPEPAAGTSFSVR